MGLSPDGPGAPLSPRLVEHLLRPGAGLLLDLDGTLVDSEPVHRAAFHEYFRSVGWTVPEEVVRSFSGRRAHEVFAATDGPWRGHDPEALTEEVIAVLRRTRTVPPPVAGAADLLEACRATALPVAVVTSARHEWARPAVDALGGEDVPLVTAEQCTHGKPHPEPYDRGVALLGLAPADVVVVEDAPAGLASARGAHVGLVLGLTTSHASATLHDADVLLPDLAPLVAAVRRRAGGGPAV